MKECNKYKKKYEFKSNYKIYLTAMAHICRLDKKSQVHFFLILHESSFYVIYVRSFS